jgi:hypothetical protein
MWPGRIQQDLENIWDEVKSTGQTVVDRNKMTDGIIQDQQNKQVLTESTGQMG